MTESMTRAYREQSFDHEEARQHLRRVARGAPPAPGRGRPAGGGGVSAMVEVGTVEAVAPAAARRGARWERVLVAVDDPYASGRALEEAVELARDQQARLRLVHVVDGGSSRLQGRGLSPEALEDVGRATGRAILLEAWRIARDLGVEAESVLLEVEQGHVGRAIVTEARRWGADVVVLGTHAHEGRHLVPLFLGSVAEVVVRTAPAPVLLVRGEGRGFGGTEAGTEAEARRDQPAR